MAAIKFLLPNGGFRNLIRLSIQAVFLKYGSVFWHAYFSLKMLSETYFRVLFNTRNFVAMQAAFISC